MLKVDLKKELKQFYQPSTKGVVRVEVPTFQFLMIDGKGDPNTSPEYARAVEALFSVSYTAKFESPRLLRRLDTLRGLSHEEVEQILTRGP